jgi:hypothetical protein
VPSFEELLPRVERAHTAVRRVIARSGCELASALLVGELQAVGWPAAFVLGHYLAPDAPAGERGPLHVWVELDGVLLDPTRDQFPTPYKRDGVLALATEYQLDFLEIE